MNSALAVVREQRDQILEDSIERQRLLVITHHSLQGWRAFKSQFVSGSSVSRVILVRTPLPREGAVTTPPEPGDTLGVTFRLGHKKCMFETRLEEVPGQTEEDVVALRWPDQLQQLQRRAYERAEPPKGVVVPVRLWREEASPATPVEARSVRYGQLEDLSAGGMRVKVADPREFHVGATFRCAFAPRPGKPALVVDALIRHREAGEQGRTSIGFQFIGLETTPEGRRVLERLARTVSHFQRTRSRNRR